MAFQEINYSLTALLESTEAFLQILLGVPAYKKTKRYCLNHPFIAAAVLSIAFFSLVPMMFFLGFIITTLAFALLCFFCIEGSLIAISGLIFIGVVSFISIIVATILSGMAIFVWALQKIGISLRPYKCASQSFTNQNEGNHEIIHEENSNHTE
nr:lipid droplet assembly factor 1-like [Parasteatoda tepidariorum]